MELRKRRRALHDAVRCRYCNMPVTPEERKEYTAWRKARGELKRGRRPKKPPENQMVMANELTIH